MHLLNMALAVIGIRIGSNDDHTAVDADDRMIGHS
jgi:uncharacterized membrane protein AbrB (regulator of aidB expression)